VVAVENAPKHFIPLETSCFHCGSTLSNPSLSSRHAKIVTLHGIYNGYSSFVKTCYKCNVFYRYQESVDGLHNFDDILFLSLGICLYIREHVQQNNSINSFVEAFIGLHEYKLNPQHVSPAYFLFEVLATQHHNFKCSICGDHLWALVTDVNRKIAFKCSMEDIEANDDADVRRSR